MWQLKATRLSQKGSTVIQDRDDRTPGNRVTASAQAPDVFARPDVFAKPQVPVLEPARQPARMPAVEQAFDPAAIMASIGETPYEWSIDSDVLAWGPNATEVLMVGSLAAISSGRNYAKLLAADATTSRFDAVIKSSARDEGFGVPYQVQYALHPAGAEKSSLDRGHRPLVRRTRTASPRGRMASSASSTSGTTRKSGSPTCRGSMA